MNVKLCASAAGVALISVLSIVGCRTPSVPVEEVEVAKPQKSVGSVAASISLPDLPEPVEIINEESECRESETAASEEWNDTDRYLLMKIAMAEAEGEDTEGKALVMLVVMNRVQSKDFPSTVYDVIYEQGQFTPILDGRFDAVEPDEDCEKALLLVTDGKWDESQGALYFESNGGDNWHSRNLEFLFQHGGQYFYR